MSAAFERDYGYGPYNVQDLHGLPDRGKAHELVDGWLIELSPSFHHDHFARVLKSILERAAEGCGVDVYVQAPLDISTPSGVRRPDVVLVSAEAARNIFDLGLSVCPGSDVQLAIEIVSRVSGSEREDRSRKVIEYARAGIDQYWLVDFEPHPRIQIRTLDGTAYGEPIVLGEKDILEISEPFPISFPISVLTRFS
ncbi:Uma2 family endonuclease [Nocardia sp. NBC_00511]|uniref:Uma2 family endonuclease n=1 Tax=Nocardia sp. NBC_00511 TaxID=2903591 RepID=UPI0030DF9409